MRHAAYRWLVAECAGRLGAGKRVQLPSCITSAVRQLWPDSDSVHEDLKDVEY